MKTRKTAPAESVQMKIATEESRRIKAQQNGRDPSGVSVNAPSDSPAWTSPPEGVKRETSGLFNPQAEREPGTQDAAAGEHHSKPGSG